VLNEVDLPLGVVTSINGSVRYLGEIVGMASHAGTTPMDRRRDAAAAAAELVLLAERRAASVPDVVATVGMLEVPNGSINVVPGRCRFSLDVRATTNEARDACAATCWPSARHLRQARPDLQPGGDDARLGRAQRTSMAGPLGAGRASRSACRSTACPAAQATTR
jgi:N-carbamoyl-L-amino-acid hydrolase